MKLTLDIPDQWILDTWITACEHSGYWADDVKRTHRDEGPGRMHIRERKDDGYTGNGPRATWHRVNWQRAIQLAITKYPHLLCDCPDAGQADALIQLGALGEIRYG